MQSRRLLPVIAMLAAVALAGFPYEREISSNAAREAYFIGNRRDSSTEKFLAQYIKRLPVPKSGPHIAEIEVRTPFQQLVRRAQQDINYSAQSAQQDAQNAKARLIVRVLIRLTPTYPAHSPTTLPPIDPVYLRDDYFFSEFRVKAYQPQEIKPLDARGTPTYLPGQTVGYNSLTGAELTYEYDAQRIGSGPLRIEVTGPGGTRTSVTFDLNALR